MDMVLSRRDDMISLFYLLLHLQTGELPFYKSSVDRFQLKEYIINTKLHTSYIDLCRSFNSAHMIPFAKEVLSLDFFDKPNYNKLRFLLEKNLLDKNMVPTK